MLENSRVSFSPETRQRFPTRSTAINPEQLFPPTRQFLTRVAMGEYLQTIRELQDTNAAKKSAEKILAADRSLHEQHARLRLTREELIQAKQLQEIGHTMARVRISEKDFLDAIQALIENPKTIPDAYNISFGVQSPKELRQRTIDYQAPPR